MKDIILKNLIEKEEKRQRETINLIASENFASPEIRKILGSALINKYSEGYPGKRYYPGCRYYDAIEKLAQKRALKVFGLNSKKWNANVQPYSGSPANFEIYHALLSLKNSMPKNKNFKTDIMGMALSSGGHLTHGHKVNFSGQNYKTIQYGVNPKTNLLDYEEIKKLAVKYRPGIIVSGASAYPRKINFQKFGEISKSIDAYHVADISHIAGLIAAKIHPSPFPHCDVVMTTTHKTLKGPRGAVIFSRTSLSGSVDKAVFPSMQGGPHNNVIAAVALTFFEALQPEFKKYQKQIVKNATVLADELKKCGFKLLTGGTNNHLMIIDLSEKGIDGLTAEKKLEKAGILASRSALTGNKSPFRPSGLRLGTPAVSSRRMEKREMKQIADWINEILIKNESPDKISDKVKKMCRKFPLF